MYQVNDATLSRRQSSCMYSQQSLNPWEQDSAQNGKRICHSKVKHLIKTGFVTFIEKKKNRFRHRQKNIYQPTAFDDAFLYPLLQQQTLLCCVEYQHPFTYP